MTDNVDWTGQAAVLNAPATATAPNLAGELLFAAYATATTLVAGTVGKRFRLFRILVHPISTPGGMLMLAYWLTLGYGAGTTIGQRIWAGTVNPWGTEPVEFPFGLDSLNTGDNINGQLSELWTAGGVGIGNGIKASPTLDVYYTLV